MAMKLSSGGWSKMTKPVSKLKASKPPRKKKSNNFTEGISEVEKLVQGYSGRNATDAGIVLRAD